MMALNFGPFTASLKRALQLGINCIEVELNAKAVDLVNSDMILIGLIHYS